ncbi:hypothetical protein [Deinococcus ficus]|uniref:hypothetical protein n=1 Tax=Deinococcus ficus TaxID=317577 RepID=UPI0005C18086|nr:hypothetical protein [Deinococcus ficus]
MTREPPAADSPFVLQDPAQAAVLLDARQRRSFLPFVGQDAAVTQAARAAGEDPNTTLRRVQRWQALGLLRVTGAQRHVRGTRVLYRAVADAFFMPHHAARPEDLLALVEAVHAPDMARLRRAYAQTGETLGGEWGIHFGVRDGQFELTPARSATYHCTPGDADAPVGLLQGAVLHLDEPDARALQAELAAVLDRYRARPGRHPYRVMVGLAGDPHAPDPPADPRPQRGGRLSNSP